MEMNKNDTFSLGLFVGFFLSTIIWISVMSIVVSSWKESAVRYGVAEYDSQTGRWKFKDIDK